MTANLSILLHRYDFCSQIEKRNKHLKLANSITKIALTAGSNTYVAILDYRKKETCSRVTIVQQKNKNTFTINTTTPETKTHIPKEISQTKNTQKNRKTKEEKTHVHV